MSQVREAVTGEYLKALRLPSLARRYEELACQAADQGWACEDYLRELLEAEGQDRGGVIVQPVERGGDERQFSMLYSCLPDKPNHQ